MGEPSRAFDEVPSATFAAKARGSRSATKNSVRGERGVSQAVFRQNIDSHRAGRPRDDSRSVRYLVSQKAREASKG